MKILLIWASADWSTYDVSQGYYDALTGMGHEVKMFKFVRRLEFWSQAFKAWMDEGPDESPAMILNPEGKAPDDISADQLRLIQIAKAASDQALVECAYFDPDLVLITSGMGFHPDAALMMRRFGYAVAVAFSECPYDDDHHAHFAQAVDYVFVNDRDSVEPLSKVARTWYMPTAYNDQLHKPTPGKAEDECDVLFIGTGFEERERILEAVNWDGINVRILGFWGFERDENSSLTRLVGDPIENHKTPALYSMAKICLNFYREGARYSLNPRAYELAANGVFQLAQDSSVEAHEIFGNSIAYFARDGSDLEAMIRYYLERPGQMREMAEESRRRVQGHSYADRARVLLDTVEAAESQLVTARTASKVGIGVPVR
jgi:spore maturation protein CgeB